MKNATLDAETAACILFGSDVIDDYEFDPSQEQFRSGADVCEALASHFGFTDADYRVIQRSRAARRQAIDEARSRLKT